MSTWETWSAVTAVATNARSGTYGDAIRVLLVDDHNGFRRSLRRLLEAEGLDVVGEAGDGCAGVVACRYWAPELVLTDYSMPLMDGLAMARLIKAGPQPPAVVMLSGEGRLLDSALLRSAGVDGLLEKGLATETIVAAVRDLVAQRRALYGQAA